MNDRIGLDCLFQRGVMIKQNDTMCEYVQTTFQGI